MNQAMQSEWMMQLSWVLIHGVWQFALVAAVVLCFNRLLFRGSSKGQYWSAGLGLVIVAACPLLTWYSISDRSGTPATSVNFVQPSNDAPPTTEARILGVLPSVVDSSALMVNDVAGNNRPSIQASQQHAWNFRWLAVAWMIGVATFSLRPMMGVWGQHQLRRRATIPATPELMQSLSLVASQIGVRQKVFIFLSEQCLGPMVIGCLRPMIVFPVALATNLSMREIEVLLAHELAHIRRHDGIANVLQVCIETVFFYHPAVWWLSREVRIAREFCCDEMATQDSASRLALGRVLLKLENDRSRSTTLALAAVDGDLLRRVRRLSTKPRQSAVSLFGKAIVCFACVGSLIGITSALSAQEASLVESTVTEGEPIQAPLDEQTKADSATQASGGNQSKRKSVDRATPASNEAAASEVEPPTIYEKETVYWDLDLTECVTIALQNARLTRPSSGLTNSGADSSATARDAALVQTHAEDESIDEFEAEIRDRIHQIEQAYWDLYAGYHDANAALFGVKQARIVSESARQNFRNGTGTRQEMAAAEAMRRDMLGRYSDAMKVSKVQGGDHLGVHKRERSLRELLSLAVSDGRLIRPTQQPLSTAPSLDTEASDAIAKCPEIKTVRRRLEILDLELSKAKDQIAIELEIDAESLAKLKSYSLNQLTDFYNLIGVRRTLARMRRIQLERVRTKGIIQEQERALSGLFYEAKAKTASLHQLSQTQTQRVQAAEQEYGVRLSEYQAGRTPVNVVLQSLERLIEAKQGRHRSLGEYMKSLSRIAMLQGTTPMRYRLQFSEEK